MLKKLVVASATVAAAAGLGLATPAYADSPETSGPEIACVITDTGKTADKAVGFGGLLGALGINDVLSNRKVEVDCRPDKQINYNQHRDSHRPRGRN